MTPELPRIALSIGDVVFEAYLRTDLTPISCRILTQMMPLHGEVIHARWSGEAMWSPLSAIWPAGLLLPAERETNNPCPGDVVLFGGAISEPELRPCDPSVRSIDWKSRTHEITRERLYTRRSRLSRVSARTSPGPWTAAKRRPAMKLQWSTKNPN